MKHNKLRKGIFETNSSSTHSLVIDRHSSLINKPDFEIIEGWDNEAYVRAESGQFGWEIELYTEPRALLSYLATSIINEHHYCKTSKEELKQKVSDAVYKVTGYYVKFDDDLYEEGLINVKYENMVYKYGYIDHQSFDQPTKVLEGTQQDIIDYLFRTDSYLKTDNDNHY